MDVGQRGQGVGMLESEGLLASLVAGFTFGTVEMLGSAITGKGVLWPVQAAASIIMRDQAFHASALAIPLGLIIHFSLVTTYGFLYGLMSSDARLATRLNPRREAGLGALYGATIWLVNFQLVARWFYPWLYETAPLGQFLLHVVAFGVVLALLFRRKERRRIEKTLRRASAARPSLT
jgi:hypothetical protein